MNHIDEDLAKARRDREEAERIQQDFLRMLTNVRRRQLERQINRPTSNH
jgi:F0F1-type ATP synthase membrane subunit b/b'